jgi:hypothetical protein
MLYPPAPFSAKTAAVLIGLFSCDPGPEPSVFLDFQNTPPQISRRAPAELQQLKTESSSPDYHGEFSLVQGVKDAAFQFSYAMNFSNTSWPLLGKSCVRPSALTITLTYAPLIYLNSEIPEGSCDHNVTLEHELRHVKVDVETLQEFIPGMKKTAAATLALLRSTEPVAAKDVEAAQQTFTDALTKTIDASTARLQEIRTLRQQAVDSREEYQRLSTACPR